MKSKLTVLILKYCSIYYKSVHSHCIKKKKNVPCALLIYNPLLPLLQHLFLSLMIL